MTTTEKYIALAKRNGLRPLGSKGNTLKGGDGQPWERAGVMMAADGTLTVYYECYRPEAMEDDDASTGGFALPARGGLTRVHEEWPAESDRISPRAIAIFEMATR